MASHKPLQALLDMRGRLAVITGAAAGIGAATASRFVEAGAAVLLLDMDERKLIGVQQELCGSEGASVDIYPIDLCHKEAIDAFWRWLGSRSPDVLVNNAGIYPFRDFLETDEAFVQRVMDVNLHAVYWMCQHFIHGCLEQKHGGAIVNLGSIEAEVPFKADMAHYTTSKAAVVALTRALARDYGSKGIRANAILPGGIMTEGTKGAAKQVWKNPRLVLDGMLFSSRLPMRRVGHPDEIARIILMLASEMSAFMTGAVVPVDGGFLSA